MKKQLFFLSLATAVLLAGCSKESTATSENGNAPQGEFVSVTLPVEMAEATVTPPSAMSQGAATPQTATRGAAQMASSEGFTVDFEQPATAETTAANAPSTRTIPQALTNVWVLQFNNAGQTTSMENIGALTSGAYLAVPRLQVGTDYTLYIVANSIATGFTPENAGTLAAFERTMFHTDAVTDAAKLPLCGKLTGVTILDLGDGTGKIKLADAAPAKMVMNRIQAEVKLMVDCTVTGYTLTDAGLYNVPIGATYGWNDTMTLFPDNAVAANFNYTSTDVAGMSPFSTTTDGTKKTYQWFIGDNRRGEVADLTAQRDRNIAKAPAYATFARITLTNSAAPAKKLFYDIYLGSGAVTNFDIKRNMTYTLAAALKGPAEYQEALVSTDARVSGVGLYIQLTDIKDDSPILISPKSYESVSDTNWGWLSTALGYQDFFNGKANTDAIMAFTSAKNYYAAQHCRTTCGPEWSLPAQAQLMLMWIYLPAIPTAERLFGDDFWSSTEYNNNQVWRLSFTTGEMTGEDKDRTNRVRCIRDN